MTYKDPLIWIKKMNCLQIFVKILLINLKMMIVKHKGQLWEEYDGYTEFKNGIKIQPEQGKLLIFPAVWSYIHRGFPPKTETKYICTGWIHTEITT